MAAYELVLTGKRLHHRSTRADNALAMEHLDRAVELDPNYAHAHAWRACVLGQAWIYGWTENADEPMNEIADILKTALALDENDSDVHRILAAVHITFDEFDKAEYHQDKALSLNPNDDLIVVQHGELLTWLGRPEEGADWIRKAMRLNPYHPPRFWNHLGRALFCAKRYDEALDAFRHLNAPDHTQLAFMAACSAYLDDTDAAKRYAGEVVKLAPDFSTAGYIDTLHYKNAGDRDHHRDGLLKAGLPE
jgi:adenylate cyclase